MVMSYIVLYNYNLIINNVNSMKEKITVIFLTKISAWQLYMYRQLKKNKTFFVIKKINTY